MTSIKAIEMETAPEAVKVNLDIVAKKLGRVPAMYRVMAHAPAVLDSYVKLNSALSAGTLGSKMSELIALAAAESNGCSYCLSAHTFFGKKIGLSDEEIEAGREFLSQNEKFQTGLTFVRKVLSDPRKISNADIEPLRRVGFTDGEILEIIGNVVRNLYTNYINIVAETEVDWPKVVEPHAKPAAL
jgi:uncharacterized peroxidase-related enzyme